ncbi:MAG: hypothetical protein M0Q25_07795 [Sulfurospirillaceae bacterium]|nr:hypothetical protein [Sulfurospirillaceae bacterium]
MKKIKVILLLVLIFYSQIFASGRLFSSIPLPQNIFLDLDEQICDDECLNELVENGQVFSFLSKYERDFQHEDTLQEFYTNLSVALNLDVQGDKPPIKLAVLYPQKKIRGYAVSTVNSIIAYFLHREHNFNLEIFNIDEEDEESIEAAVKEIRESGFSFVVAPLTLEGADLLLNYSKDLNIFIPTVNKNLLSFVPQNVLFGGIDYEKQILTLFSQATHKIALFTDGSLLATNLDKTVADIAGNVGYSREIGNGKVDFKAMLNGNKYLNNSSIFLNTPLVKSSLLASQFRVYDIEPYNLLSTQINFHPMLLTLTQYEDRKNLLIANSIDFIPSQLRIFNQLFGHSIEYDWVNYATSIGVDYFYVTYFNSEATPLFKEKIVNGQVDYRTKLFKANRYQLVEAQ